MDILILSSFKFSKTIFLLSIIKVLLLSIIFEIGTTNVLWTITDGSGNTKTCSYTVFIHDILKPVITCTSNINVDNDPGVCGAAVNYAAPVATDNCEPVTVTQIAGLASGFVFPVGQTINTFVANDTSGNGDTCSFTVTVTDNEKPLITCLGNQVKNNNIGKCAYTTIGNEFDLVSMSDNCKIDSITNNITNLKTLSGYEFPIGSTNVIWTVTDRIGNSSTCSYSITVDFIPSITLDSVIPFCSDLPDFVTDYNILGGNPEKYSIIKGTHPMQDFINITDSALSSSVDVSVPEGTQAGIYNFIITMKDSSSCILLNDTFSVTVKQVPKLPVISEINPICENDTISLKTSGATTGSTFSWIGPLGFSASTSSFSIFNATPNMSGIYSLTNTLNGCVSDTSIDMEVDTRPEILSVKNDSVCGEGYEALSATASAGSINWYNGSTGGIQIGTSENNQLWQIPSSIDTTTTYYVDATNKGCTTLSRTPVLAIIYICKDTVPPVYICSSFGTYDLFNSINPDRSKTGVWTDIDTSGALFNDSLLNLTLLNNRTYAYSYLEGESLSILKVTVTKFLSPGKAEITQQLCTRDIQLFTGLKPGTYDLGGIWMNDSGQIIPDTITSGIPGMNYYYYYFKPNGICEEDTSIVSFFIDNIPPQIICAKDKKVELFFDSPYFEVQNDSLDAQASDNCGISKILNDLNNTSTLNGQKFQEGIYPITWIAWDSAEVENTCITTIIVNTFKIPNFFSPNNDGYNDTWDFSIDISHPNAIIEVFNRWGEKVWTSERGYYTKWNGQGNDGRSIPDDGYVYVITENGSVIASGSVTILR